MSKWFVTLALLGLVVAAGACKTPGKPEPIGVAVQALDSVPENESFGTPRLSFQWADPDATDVVSASSSLTATISNNSAAGLEVEVVLNVTGLDHRERTVTLSSYGIGANGTQTVTIQLSTLPIQSVGIPSQLILRAVELGATEPVRAFTTPMSYEFTDDDYDSVKLRGRATALFEADVETPEELFDPESPWMEALGGIDGKVTDATGSLVDFRTMTPMMSGGAKLGPSLPILIHQNSITWPTFPWLPGPNNAGPDTSRICARWRADFVDAAFGDDYITAPVAAYYPHAYGSIHVQKVGGSGAGYDLDRHGCTVPIPLEPDAWYTIKQSAIVKRNGLMILAESGFNTYSIVTAFQAGSAAYTTLIELKPGNVDEFTRTAVVAGQVLKEHGTITFDNSNVYVYPLDPCPGGGSCLQDGKLYLGGDNGISDTYSKVIIAHELGHAFQLELTGLPKTGFIASATEPLCLCDHVIEASNRAHCLQSRHHTSLGSTEGFAHYFAARTFNDPTEYDCVFPYYKEFLTSGGTQPPPYVVDCTAQTKWMETQCPVTTGEGVEMDWMQFFWALMRPVADATTMADLDAIYDGACGGTCSSHPTVGDNVLYDGLRTAAQTHYGALSAKQQFFEDEASQHGVNH